MKFLINTNADEFNRSKKERNEERKMEMSENLSNTVHKTIPLGASMRFNSEREKEREEEEGEVWKTNDDESVRMKKSKT